MKKMILSLLLVFGFVFPVISFSSSMPSDPTDSLSSSPMNVDDGLAAGASTNDGTMTLADASDMNRNPTSYDNNLDSGDISGPSLSSD